jgi:hypothetical protein
MAKKKKPAKKKYKKVPETLQTQFTYSVDPAFFKTRAEALAAVARAKAHFERTGRSIKGVEIVARWRNPDRQDANAARWKDTTEAGQSLYDYWTTIHKRRF